jgi:hypothetical protein
MLALPQERAEFLRTMASRGRADPRQADVAAVSRQINLALFYDAQLDIGAV